MGNEQVSELHDIDALVHRYQPRLLRFVAFATGDLDLAETITQDCFLKAYAARDRFRGDCGAFTWLTAIAVNLIRDHQRSEKFRFWNRVGKIAVDASTMASFFASAEVPAERNLLAQERARAVASALEVLSPQQKRVFLLRFVEEMTMEEICRATGMKLATVKTHIHRAVKVVRVKVGEAL